MVLGAVCSVIAQCKIAAKPTMVAMVATVATGQHVAAQGSTTDSIKEPT